MLSWHAVVFASLLAVGAIKSTVGFQIAHYGSSKRIAKCPLYNQRNSSDGGSSVSVSRRNTLRRAVLGGLAAAFEWKTLATPVYAAQRQPLEEVLYRIVRVREAAQQETRLIKSGKFKDLQRANVKLAIKFMVENYRLNDAFVTASGYLDGNSRRVEAGQVGQTVVQNLYTILEYFDSSDVENIKVGQSSMTGKEDIVLKGLDATRESIDDFLAYFPKAAVDTVTARVAQENALNIKEFDPSLGDLLNVAVPSV